MHARKPIIEVTRNILAQTPCSPMGRERREHLPWGVAVVLQEPGSDREPTGRRGGTGRTGIESPPQREPG